MSKPSFAIDLSIQFDIFQPWVSNTLAYQQQDFRLIGLPFVLSSPSGSRTFYVHAALSQAQTPGTTEKAVAALEQQWLQSQKTNNPDLVAPLLADKFVNTGSDGKVVSKAKMLADSKATKYDSIDYEDVKVTVFGDTAIATGGSKAKGTDASGKPIDEHVRWTDHG